MPCPVALTVFFAADSVALAVFFKPVSVALRVLEPASLVTSTVFFAALLVAPAAFFAPDSVALPASLVTSTVFLPASLVTSTVFEAALSTALPTLLRPFSVLPSSGFLASWASMVLAAKTILRKTFSCFIDLSRFIPMVGEIRKPWGSLYPLAHTD